MSVKIGYKNIIADAVVSATNADANYPVANLADGLAFDFWSPADSTGATISIDGYGTADYFGITHHNLADVGAVLTLQRYTGSWVTVSTFTFTTNKPFMQTFTAATSGGWRVVVSASSGIPVIGNLFLGELLDVGESAQIGFRPPLSMKTIGTPSTSVTGDFIGSTIRSMAEDCDLKFKYLTPAWIRSTWMPFYEHIKSKPVLIQWDSATYTDEVAYAWADPKRLNIPKYSTSVHMDIDLKLLCDTSGDYGAMLYHNALNGDAVPEVGTGALTFTRAAPDASYIDSADGLLKYATTNVLRYERGADGVVHALIEEKPDESAYILRTV